jgi:hypothetical protein
MPAKENYIPTPDAQLYRWARKVIVAVAADTPGFAASTETVAAVQAKQTTFDTSFNGMISRRDAAEDATIPKNQSRKEFKAVIRSNAGPIVGDRQKLSAGLPVYAIQPTRLNIHSQAPEARINPARLMTEFRFNDPQSPNGNYRPYGVTAIEIIGFIGDEPPTSLNDYVTMGAATCMRHVINFKVGDGGKKGWFRFRWVGTHGEVGTWSPQYESVIWP